MVLACTPCGIAQQLADQVEIVDRVHGDLDARQALEEGHRAPTACHRQQRVEIDDLAEQALGDGILAAPASSARSAAGN